MKAKVLKLFIFLGFVCSLVLIGVSAFATSSAVKIVDAAEIRTTGNQGLRFTASVDTLVGTDEHGFYLAIGSHSLEDFNSAVSEGSETIGESKLLQVPVEDEDTTFKAVVINIPEEYYTQEISAVAYVREGEKITLSDAAVTTSVAEVAVKAAANGETGVLIDDIFTYLNDNYKYYTTIGNQAFLASLSLESSVEVSALKAEFIDDVNAFCGSSLGSNCTMKELCSVLANVSWSWIAYGTDITESNAFKFFQNVEMKAKWDWLLEYLLVNGSPNTKLQAFELLDDGIYSKVQNTFGASSGLFSADHAISEVWLILNQQKATSAAGGGNISADYTNFSKYEEINSYYKTTLTYKYKLLVEVGENITLPKALEKVGYTWNGWNDGTNVLHANSNYDVTNDSIAFNADFTVIEFTITYNDGKNELTQLGSTYTIEDKVTLKELNDEPGFTFVGWYDNEELEGTAITTISAGTTGDKVYYAKWIEEYSEIVVNPQWSELVNGDTVEFDSVEYTYGSNAHATIGDALSFIKENGTIYLAAGTYNDETLTISKNNIKIYGQNAEIAGNAVRNEEAVLNNTVITLSSSVKGTELVGLKFAGTSQVLGLAGIAGTGSAVAGNHDGFTFKNNYVNSSLTTGNGFIYFVEAASGYTTNPEISYNYFTGSTLGTTAYIYLDNNRNLKFNYNVFENVSTDALYVNDKTKGLSGTSVELNNNTFTNINGYAIKINWYSPDNLTSNGVMTFNNNTFTNVTTAIYFRSCNNADKLTKLEIKGNTFTGTLINGIHFGRVVNGITYDISENNFECVPTTSYYNLVSTTNGTNNTTVNVSNNTYKSEGVAINPESTKILGTGIAK